MASKVKIRLEGGPCAGRNATVTRTGDLLPAFTCEHVEYEPTAKVTQSGRVVYTTKASQKPKPVPGSGSGATPNRAHSSWHDMLHSMFVQAPKELHTSANARQALRHLAKRKGLR